MALIEVELSSGTKHVVIGYDSPLDLLRNRKVCPEAPYVPFTAIYIDLTGEERPYDLFINTDQITGVQSLHVARLSDL